MLGKNILSVISKNFSAATKAKIKFIGKRSLLPKDHNHNSHSQKETEINNSHKQNDQLKSNNNPLSSFTLNSYRLKISNEELEVINNGGPLNFPDWNKIKLKPKAKKI